ncbi:hypothetical protein Golomagni_06139, partial [Golovinomyces magnicellulatus]
MDPSPGLFNPTKDIPQLTGKIILITGGYSGLGRQCALDLASHGPAEIWIAGRNAEKAKGIISTINSIAPAVSVNFLPLSLDSFASIQLAAKQFAAKVTRLDILILNAGILHSPPRLTEDGYEVLFGTNQMGHALLFRLLTPLLLATSDLGIADASQSPNHNARVVFVSSDGHKHPPAGGIRFDLLKTEANSLSAIARYGQSKLANVLYAREISTRFPLLTAVSLDPGPVKTQLHQRGGRGATPLPFWIFETFILPFVGKDVKKGVYNHLWAATSNDVVNGQYYEP